MPRLRELVDKSLPEHQKLASQYVTCIEAGGAHAHLFYPLLDFLELKTLVVTDLDSIKKVEKENNKKKKINVWEKCPVAEGTRTCNTAIRYWFAPKDIKKIEDFHLSPVELSGKSRH
ncbi:hypothetical protein MSC38_19070 [Acinetobacter baumannii]|jgi:predicted ATP-dependent endonuclease of OLD family|nr:hypothetical protein [Acinetobacter baumannii]